MAPGGTTPTCCSTPCAACAPGRVGPDGGGAHAGHVQLGLLRARLPGPANGRGAGRGQDLFVDNGYVYMRTTRGPKRVDVIYRRLDDDFLDPKVFRADSQLGCAGWWTSTRPARSPRQCHRHRDRGRQVHLPYVPKMIEFYLGEAHPEQRPHLRLPRRQGPGLHPRQPARTGGEGSPRRRGYGMLVGPGCQQRPRSRLPRPAHRQPAQLHRPAHAVAVHLPDLCGEGIARATSTCGPSCSRAGVRMVPGGLTRVALKEGSLVVSSSQGGGTKDTWVLETDEGTQKCFQNCRPPVLAQPLHRTGRKHRPHAGHRVPDLAATPVPGRSRADLAQPALDLELDALYARATTRPTAAASCSSWWPTRTTSRPSSAACVPRVRTRVRCAGADDRSLGDHEPNLAGVPQAAQGRLAARPRHAVRVGQSTAAISRAA